MHKQHKIDIYTQSGIYKLTCPACNKAYVGQTGRNFTVRFNEHKHAFRTNSHTSRFAQHLIEHNHPIGTIHNTRQILWHHKKGPHLNTLERFHIHAEYITNNHINDNQTIFPNKIFDILLKDHSQENPPRTPAPWVVRHPITPTQKPHFRWKDTTWTSPHGT
jgi:hypothetical protein